MKKSGPLSRSAIDHPTIDQTAAAAGTGREPVVLAEVDRFASGCLPIGTSGTHYLPPRQLEEMAGGIDLPWNARSGPGPSPLARSAPRVSLWRGRGPWG